MAEAKAAADSGAPSDARREQLAGARRTVIKVGTRVLTHPDGTLALARLYQIIEAAARLRREGRDVLMVTSGAVGLGRDALGLTHQPRDAAVKQMCAAVGQSRLMELYEQGFGRLGIVCAQILITWTDFDDRLRYLNLHTTLDNLLARGVVPVINENDVLSLNDRAYVNTDKRPIFDDNDRLSALVASELTADVLVLLTDVQGVMTRDPRTDPNAELVARIDDPREHGVEVSGPAVGGRGGMSSKLAAALLASHGGCNTVIASGMSGQALARIFAGDAEGTWIPARDAALAPRSRWIAYCCDPKGILYLDTGAVSALRHRRASLLAKGVARLTGEFRRGDVVELRGQDDDAVVGRGIVPVDATTARRWMAGDAPPEARNRHALIDREHLVLAKEDTQ